MLVKNERKKRTVAVIVDAKLFFKLAIALYMTIFQRQVNSYHGN
ncbi:MAG: hypothetical protein QNJ41_19865 [Xenococcaceae cyanobacterium MO_188.B32]|nr:hypothetical protein [Xenococcaceae cyanobacterium MO_188.B32]